jgi:hypothetical protein
MPFENLGVDFTEVNTVKDTGTSWSSSALTQDELRLTSPHTEKA